MEVLIMLLLLVVLLVVGHRIEKMETSARGKPEWVLDEMEERWQRPRSTG